MTYKNAVAGLNLGGGKSVIIGDNKTTDREMIFRAHGRFVESLGGRYITAEDVGTSTADMDFVHMETDYVSRSRGPLGRSVAGHGARRVPRDPGVGEGALGHRTTSPTRRSRCRAAATSATTSRKELHEAGAKLIVTDIDAERVKRVVERVRRARRWRSTRSTASKADIFAPCALGAIINDKTIPQLKVEIVAGAREQPAARGAARRRARGARHPLRARLRGERGRRDQRLQRARRLDVGARRSARRTRSTTRCSGCSRSRKTEKIPTYLAADRLAEQRIRAVGSMVRTWPQWPNK